MSGWQCGARKQGSAGGNDPADCDWPFCGCDPYADKVLSAAEESGQEFRRPLTREGIVEAMRDDPYWNDVLGTTDQDARFAHYADAILARFSATPNQEPEAGEGKDG